MIQTQKKDFWGADIAFVFLIRPKGESSRSGATYPQNCGHLGTPQMGTTTSQPGQEIQSIGLHPSGGYHSCEVVTHYLVKPRGDQATANDNNNLQKKVEAKLLKPYSHCSLKSSSMSHINHPPMHLLHHGSNKFCCLSHECAFATPRHGCD